MSTWASRTRKGAVYVVRMHGRHTEVGITIIRPTTIARSRHPGCTGNGGVRAVKCAYIYIYIYIRAVRKQLRCSGSTRGIAERVVRSAVLALGLHD